jgi:hypothetical protein
MIPVRMSEDTLAVIINRAGNWLCHWAWSFFGGKIEPIEDEE